MSSDRGVTRAILLALSLLLTLAACTKSPYERGFALGEEHAKLLRAGQLTFDRFTADLDRADRDLPDADERRELRRGYAEATESVRVELAKMLVEALAVGAADQAGQTARALVDAFKSAIETPEGRLDREKIHSFGQGVGKFLREVDQAADEFQKGVDEGLKNGE